MTTVAEIIEKMEKNFDTDAAAGMDKVFQFSIEDGESFYVEVKDCAFSMTYGDNADPSVTLLMNTETLTGIMTGTTDGMQAFMAGQLRAEGDMMLATKLSELFPQ